MSAKEDSARVENANKKLDNLEIQPPDAWYGVRHTQMILLFIMIFIGYGMRVNLSVAIVAMTDPTVNPAFPTYDWTIKSTILSSFFWGYVIPQVGVGQLAEIYGPKWFLTGAMSVTAIFTLLIPIMAEVGAWGIILCRVIQGFSQGFFFPCMHTLLSNWVPLQERSRLGTFVYAGSALGTVVTMPVTGWISASSIGWPSVFYIYGAAGIGWTLIWFFMGTNGPFDHKSISEEEKMYIEKTCGEKSAKKVPTPWLDIAKSLPVWAILIAHCGQNWGFWTLMTEIPTYMSSILNFNIADNGLMSGAPYFALWVLSFFFSYVTDLVINKRVCSVAAARKILTTIGLVGPAIALFSLGFLHNASTGATLALLITAVGINSAVFCGHQVNHIDIAPSHAGTLMGITNGGANVFSIIAPLFVQFVVTNEEDPDQWKIVFFIASGVYVGCSLFFIIFGKGEVQYWDNKEVNKNENDTINEKPIETKTA